MRTINPISSKKLALLTALLGASLLGACGGGGGGNSAVASSSSAGTVAGNTDYSISGVATKGPIDAATVTAYALDSNGARGEYLGTATTNVDGAFSLSTQHKGAVALVVSGGTYIDEASGTPVTLAKGIELETLLGSLSEKNSVAITALTTIAAARARENASVGLAIAIAAANKDLASAFGLAGVDIATTIPADLTKATAAQASKSARQYGLVQAGLTQFAEDQGIAPADVLAMVGQMAEDFGNGRFDGRNNRGAGLAFALTITPQQALAGLQKAMAAFLASAENKSGETTTEVIVPGAEATLTGHASKGPIAGGTVNIYRLNPNGSRGELLASTLSDAVGNFSVPLDVPGPVAVVVTGGRYSDEATGESVSLNEAELETLLPDAVQPRSVAVTALTTIAAKRASANAAAGLNTAIAAANAEVTTLFELGDVDISSTIPADLTQSGSASSSEAAQAYGLSLAALSQVAKLNGAAPADVLALVKGMADDFSDGEFDGFDSANRAIESALNLTPAAAAAGLEKARLNFLEGPRNATERIEIPRPGGNRL